MSALSSVLKHNKLTMLAAFALGSRCCPAGALNDWGTQRMFGSTPARRPPAGTQNLRSGGNTGFSMLHCRHTAQSEGVHCRQLQLYLIAGSSLLADTWDETANQPHPSVCLQCFVINANWRITQPRTTTYVQSHMSPRVANAYHEARCPGRTVSPLLIIDTCMFASMYSTLRCGPTILRRGATQPAVVLHCRN